MRRLEYREIERRAPAATHAARAGGESLDRWPLDSRTPASTSDAFSDRRLVIDRRPLLTLPVAITRLASPSLRLQDDPLPSPSPSPAAYAPMWLADSHTVQFCSVQFGRNSVLARLGYRLSCSRCYRHATSLRCGMLSAYDCCKVVSVDAQRCNSSSDREFRSRLSVSGV